MGEQYRRGTAASSGWILVTVRYSFTNRMGYDVGKEVEVLLGHIKRLSDGGDSVTFKTLFEDDCVANELESLAGTLKAAKKQGKVSYGPELLLQGMSDAVVISLTNK